MMLFPKGDSGGPLIKDSWITAGTRRTRDTESTNVCKTHSRYTVTAVASFGPRNDSLCGVSPGGFTRLTPKVLQWVKINAEITSGQGKFNSRGQSPNLSYKGKQNLETNTKAVPKVLQWVKNNAETTSGQGKFNKSSYFRVKLKRIKFGL